MLFLPHESFRSARPPLPHFPESYSRTADHSVQVVLGFHDDPLHGWNSEIPAGSLRLVYAPFRFQSYKPDILTGVNRTIHPISLANRLCTAYSRSVLSGRTPISTVFPSSSRFQPLLHRFEEKKLASMGNLCIKPSGASGFTAFASRRDRSSKAKP